ncbi:MAG: T9SS type A sorting domain-containing protein [Flavobacterium sp.]|uniref:T9SS type A sorting domain-containing protein n=1 Tax=Flavobacterium sp. TaxID=239 RepID=UPI003BBCE337
MKKSLLNHKSLHFAILLLLLCANVSVAQRTIIHETFGGVDIADPYTGGTSTTPASPNQITYTKATSATVSAAVSVGTSSSSGYLSITAGAVPAPVTTTGRTYLSAPITSGNFVQILKNNPYPITWTFNMRLNRSSNIAGLTSNANSNYAPAVVLAASSSDLLSETTKGYAVSISLGSVALQQKIELSSFTGGLGFAGTTPVAPVSIISSPDFLNGSYVSVKVTYTPSTDTWSLAVKDSGTGPFTDPATDTYPTPQTAINTVNTSETMTHFGYFYCHKSNGSVSGTVFRTDNYKVVLESPFVPLPTVEKRQAFNSITSPTVFDLVATGVNGGTINWYDVPSGGLSLSLSTPLDYKNYYVSQTVSGVESDRVVSQVFVGDTTLKTLPFHEDFANYNTNDKLIVINNDSLSGTGLGSWSVNNPSITAPFGADTDDALIAAQPSSWISSVLPTPTGKAITFDKSGIDPQILFNAPTAGSVYASCLFMVTNLLSDSGASITNGTSGTSADTPKAPGQFFSLGYSAGAGQNTAYTAAVYLKTSTIDATKFNIGINASPSDPILADDIKWDTTDYEVNTPITLVTSYSYDDYVSRLWINPTDNSAEPTANATTLPRSAALAVDRLRLTQQSSATTPFITLDEIRVANNWGEALGASSTLGITPVKSTGIKIYPNPVSNGKLYIASATNLEKEVAIYNTLGQEVLQSKTNNQAINVSNLSKGTYFVKITEAGITVTKKLIIQ